MSLTYKIEAAVLRRLVTVYSTPSINIVLVSLPAKSSAPSIVDSERVPGVSAVSDAGAAAEDNDVKEVSAESA